MQPQRPSLSQHLHSASPMVDPRWIAKALLGLLSVAMACAYALICALFYFQQWQLVLHPSRTVTSLPSSVGLPSQDIRFLSAPSGNAQMQGWWIPSETPADPTVLLLHGADGSMSDALPLARELHNARLNVLLFDYRGYGHSAGAHPDSKAMQADAESALAWLATSGHAASGQLLVAGTGIGASLASTLCVAHPQISGLILVDGDGDTAQRASRDARSRIVPFRLLYHEDFPLADTLSTLTTPKLLVSHTALSAPVDVQRAADPKMTFEIGASENEKAMQEALRRFRDTYLHQPPSQLRPENQP